MPGFKVNRIVTAAAAKRLLQKFASPARAKVLQRFFKTGPGEYAAGDIFLGATVPQVRKAAAYCSTLPLAEIQRLLGSSVHEHRLLALLILVDRFAKGSEHDKERVFRMYEQNLDRVNNWDLVDLSAPKIVGAYLEGKPLTRLRRMARSSSLWQRRIAVISTYHFINNDCFTPTLSLAAILVKDKEDLIHKAVGWMLREVGKRSMEAEEQFLEKHAARMPRTMLRYAIERFPEKKRRRYMSARALRS